MRRYPISIFLWLTIFGLSGCTQYQAVPAAKSRDIGGVFQVSPRTSWSTIKSGNREIWTINGASLQSIVFVTKIKPGQSLVDGAEASKEDRPTYKAGMKAPDIVNLFEATLISNRYSQIEISGLRPVERGGRSAFRFDFSGFDAGGLRKRGFAFVTADDEIGLSLVVFEAAAEHYYDAFAGEAEAIFKTLKII